MTLTQLIEDAVQPVNWLAPPWVAPGRPTLLYGAKDTAKSLIAMDLVLATAYGRPWLSAVKLQRRGRAVFMDYEPKVHPQVRVRQLIDFDPRTAVSPLREQDLETHCPPKKKLTDPQAEEWLCRVCMDTALLVIDGLAAATPGRDERAIEYRAALDLLASVSNQTGVCIMVVHHEGLSGGRPRGHTGISQACGTEIRVTKKGSQIKMECTSPGPAGSAPKPITVELTAEGGLDSNTGLAARLRLRPARERLGKVVEFPLGNKKEAPPAPAPQKTDEDLVHEARERFGDAASTVGVRKLRELGIGTTRAKKIQELLRC